MGSCDFSTTVMTDAGVGTAYRHAVDEARREYGDNPYSGSISTTDGYRQVLSTPLTRSAAGLYASVHIEDGEKWGAALAVPVARDERFTFKKARMTVTIDPVNEYGRGVTEWEIRYAAIAQACAKYGSALHDVKVTPKVKTEAVVSQTAGRPVTRYEVTTNGHRTTLHATKAQALAEAKRAASVGGPAVKVRTVKYYPEASTTNLATVEVRVVSATAVLDIVVATPKKGDTPTEGWLFFGLAAC